MKRSLVCMASAAASASGGGTIYVCDGSGWQILALS
jgi:hypothetical protein